MTRDGENIAKRVTMEAGHSAEVGGKSFAPALLKLLNQGLDVGGNNFLRRLPLRLLLEHVYAVLHGGFSLAIAVLDLGI